MIVNVASIETVTLQTVTSVSQNVEPAIISEPSIETIKTVLPVPVVQTGVPIPVQSSIVTVYISGLSLMSVCFSCHNHTYSKTYFNPSPK